VQGHRNVVNVEWMNDGKTFLYTVPDALNRPSAVYMHVLGSSSQDDLLLFEESDPKMFVDLGRTKDRVCHTPVVPYFPLLFSHS
jgi:oligopeptidase B